MAVGFIAARGLGSRPLSAGTAPCSRSRCRRRTTIAASTTLTDLVAPGTLAPVVQPTLPPDAKKASLRAVFINAGLGVLIFAAALGIGIVIGQLIARKGASERVESEQEAGSRFSGFPVPVEGEETAALENGGIPIWLNYALARLWALFQKNTQELVSDIIQPVLDETGKPDIVTAVRILSFDSGTRPPYISSLKRLPSRALAEVQYSVQGLFSSNSVIQFEVDIKLESVEFSVPVTLRNLDIDAQCWSNFTLVPYAPFCSSIRYAFLSRPKVSFDMKVAHVLPITAVPILRSFFQRVVTKEIPSRFLFPRTVNLDFTPEGVRAKRGVRDTVSVADLESLSLDELVDKFPEQWALFDALDLDKNGSLSPIEIFAGLRNWGYSAMDATESFDRLDLDGNSSVSFLEFCQMWPALAASFVPNRYQGILTVFVRRADELTRPWLGFTDPVVTLRVGGEKVTGKPDSQTLGIGGPGSAIWNEAFELNCRSPNEDKLEIVVEESKLWTWRGPKAGKTIGMASFPLASLVKRPNQQVKVRLEPAGYLRVDLSYADFIDQGGLL